MSELPKKHKDQLERLKQAVENSHKNFKENIDRYNDFRRMVFVTSLSDNEITMLKTLKKPVVEFPILEAYISRLRGEFSKQEPSIEVHARDGVETDTQILELLENHIRNILDAANKDGLEYNVYTDTLSGGYSVVKVYTDYTSPMSFHQDIFIKRVYDPTMTGFDPMAMKEDKSDGEYCFEIFPMSKKEFERKYPDLDISSINFGKSLGDFRWSYESGSEKIILIADFYEKKHKKVKICMLSNGQVMTMDEYKKFLEEWEADGIIAQAPVIVGKPRWTEQVNIVRYKFIENQVFDYQETSYKSLPYIFIDGNSVVTRQHEEGAVKQVTRPYVYQAKGAQKLKNFAGQSLANELENMSMAKMAMPKDGIPPAYKDAYVEPQKANVYVYNAFKDDDPNVPLPAPIFMPRPQIPPEIGNTFQMSDALTQNILGSFDASMTKLTEQQVSGIAIQETATLSNAAAMPYVVSFMRGLQSIGERVVELIPLYQRTPRTIPVLDAQGKRSYVKINQEGGVSLDYDDNAIQVKIEAGVNFGVQKSRAYNQIIQMMNTSPVIAEFVASVGMKYILDNIEMRGQEAFKEDVEKWMEERKRLAAQQQQQPTPEQQMAQAAQFQVQAEAQNAAQKNAIHAQEVQTKSIISMAELDMERQKNQVEMMKALAEIERNLEQSMIAKNEHIAAQVKDAIMTELEVRKHELAEQESRAAHGLEMLGMAQEEAARERAAAQAMKPEA